MAKVVRSVLYLEYEGTPSLMEVNKYIRDALTHYRKICPPGGPRSIICDRIDVTSQEANVSTRDCVGIPGARAGLPRKPRAPTGRKPGRPKKST